MANYCSIYGQITLKDEKKANYLAERINDSIDKNQRLDFGGRVCMLDVTAIIEKNEITLYCDVKWVLDQRDMVLFVKWLGQYVPVKEMEIQLRYEEMGCNVLGKYRLYNGTLEDFYIPDNEFPKYPEIKDSDNEDEIYDAYMDQLYEMVDHSGGCVIYDYNTKAA